MADKVALLKTLSWNILIKLPAYFSFIENCRESGSKLLSHQRISTFIKRLESKVQHKIGEKLKLDDCQVLLFDFFITTLLFIELAEYIVKC